MKFPEKLMLLRKEKGFTQEELADQLGVTRQAVSRWEAGETTPDMAPVIKLCDVFDVSADYLIREDRVREEKSISPAPQRKANDLRLISAVCFAFGAFCAIIGIAASVTDAQRILSVINAILLAGSAGLQFYLYIRDRKH